MKKKDHGVSTHASNSLKIDQLENLVDELVKHEPREERIKAYMREAGLGYVADPIERLNTVLQALEGNGRQPGKLTGDHDKSI